MRKIEVVVKSAQKHDKIEPMGGNLFRVSVKAPAQEGRANQAVLEVVSRHFGVIKSRCHLLMGARSKRKLIGLE